MGTAVMALDFIHEQALQGQQNGANPATGDASGTQPAADGQKMPTRGMSAQQDINNNEVETRGDHDAVSSVPTAVSGARRIVGLALEGGGALGLAHIGVLAWLDEHRVPVDRIAGTSKGCLMASAGIRALPGGDEQHRFGK